MQKVTGTAGGSLGTRCWFHDDDEDDVEEEDDDSNDDGDDENEQSEKISNCRLRGFALCSHLPLSV